MVWLLQHHGNVCGVCRSAICKLMHRDRTKKEGGWLGGRSVRKLDQIVMKTTGPTGSWVHHETLVAIVYELWTQSPFYLDIVLRRNVGNFSGKSV